MRRATILMLAGCWTSQPVAERPRPTPSAQPVAGQPISTAAVEPEPTSDGDETALNSKRWIYASFFNRLKRKVASHWQPAAIWTALPPDVAAAHGTGTRTCVLEISLTDAGALSRFAMRRSSGVTELDVEAIRAFQAAAPFAVPPPALLTNGTLTFQFSFVFEVAAGTGSTSVTP